MILKDVYGDIMERLTLQEIGKVSRVSRCFREYCMENKGSIERIKRKALREFLQEKEEEVEEYAYKNRICYDEKTRERVMEEYKMCEVENKYTVQLLYLVNGQRYEEAYVMLTCEEVEEPNGTYIFRSRMFEAFPGKLVGVYMKKLPCILELFGYDNVDDFYEDWPLTIFRNKHLREYIRRNVR